MRVSAAGNMPLQGLVKPPAKPVVMITSSVSFTDGFFTEKNKRTCVLKQDCEEKRF